MKRCEFPAAVASAPAPIFSVVIPTCNRPAMLERAVRSVLAQSFHNFEIIIVDDSGTGGESTSLAWKGLDRVSIVKTDTNVGAAAARNIGVEHARGQFISFLDDDDEYYPSFLAQTYRHLGSTSNTVGLSMSGVRYIDYDAETGLAVSTATRHLTPDLVDPTSLYRQFLSMGVGCGVTIKSSCLKKTGKFDVSFKTVEDTDLFYSILSSGFQPLLLPSVEVTVHRHCGGRLSSVHLNRLRIQECQRLIEKHAELMSTMPFIHDGLVTHMENLKRRLVAS